MKISLVAILCFMMSFGVNISRAQQSSGPTTESPLEIQNAVGDVLVAGLVGGILGLSTLSFYPNPEDNIRNIYFGAAAGAIVMTLYMTFRVATTPLPSNLNSPTGQLDPWVTEDSFGLAYNLKF
jgi:hypothetical protein